MNIRRGLSFAWRIAVAYLKVSVTMALVGAGFIGATLLVATLVRDGFSGGLLESMRLIVQVISFTALGLCAMLGVGLMWNVIGVVVGMSLTEDDLELSDLRVTIPQRLFIYNLIGLPFMLVLLSLLTGFPSYAAICIGVLSCLISFASANVARSAWIDVANWYEFRGANVKRKKGIVDKLKVTHDDTASDDLSLYEVDEQNELQQYK